MSDNTSVSWVRNTVVEYAKHAAQTHEMLSNFSRILIIYCGGTIGMKHDPIRGYMPVPGFLTSILSNMDCFNDPEYLKSKFQTSLDEFDTDNLPIELGPVHVTPPSIFDKRMAYQILEYSPLKDSSSMSMVDWITIAADIEKYYHLFDSFIVLHGTDTMAYTASALSFMLENLGKTVILTGSQIPFSEIRNDAKENLLGALTIAGHYNIPEVCLFFNNKLFRGNRSSKINAVEFDAFESPNLIPLAKLGVNIQIEWAEILRPTTVKPFVAHKKMNPYVGCLRLFPGITVESVKAFCSEKMKGIVLETFGTGNAPDNRPELIQVFKDATDRGVVIVNISQCLKGSVSDSYSSGINLYNAGVVPGRDMTTECALTKLSYLLSKDEYDPLVVAHLMTENLCGELTIPIQEKLYTDRRRNLSWIGSVFKSSILAASGGHHDAADHLLRPLLFHHAAANGDIHAMRDLLRKDFMIDCLDYDGRTALHVAIRNSQVEAVKWLITHGSSIHVRDSHGRSAMTEALENFVTNRTSADMEIIDFISKAGGKFSNKNHRICEFMAEAMTNADFPLLEILEKYGFDFSTASFMGKDPMNLAAYTENTNVQSWIIEKLDSLTLNDSLSTT